jgi:hypothetical protein
MRTCGEAGSGSGARWRLPLHPVKRGPAADSARGARRADGGVEHLFPMAFSSSPSVWQTAAQSTSSRWPPLHHLRRGGRRWQCAVVGQRRRAPLRDGELLFPTASSSPLWRGGRWWWDGGGQQWARPFGFCFFYSFEKLFAESLKILMAHHCREHELQLTA